MALMHRGLMFGLKGMVYRPLEIFKEKFSTILYIFPGESLFISPKTGVPNPLATDRR